MISKDKAMKILNNNQTNKKYTDEETKKILDWIYLVVEIESKVNSGIKENKE
jgi:hypothetical protein